MLFWVDLLEFASQYKVIYIGDIKSQGREEIIWKNATMMNVMKS